MLTVSSYTSRVAAILALAAASVSAIAITSPSVATIWDSTGANPDYVLWQLYPPTNPPPATQYFDIYIRNAVGAMYDPPLNIPLAINVDSLGSTFFGVKDMQRFKPGPGYQLFFSDPTNPDIVYCDSDVFCIGTPIASATPVTPPSSSLDISTSSEPASPSSSAASSPLSSASTSHSRELSVSASTTTTTTTTTELSTTTKEQPEGTLVAATVPGGPDQQGFDVISGARGLGLSLATTVGVAAAGMFALVA
ncbi:hypothetical protein JCM11641_001551 [Rhodosporidiobolus odoratus]